MTRISRSAKLAAVLCLAGAFFSGSVTAQCVSVTSLGTPVAQNFDTLAATGTNIPWTDNSTLPGWYSTRSTYNAGTGSSNAGALYSFGVAGTNPVTDRALGSVASGTTTTIFAAVCFINNTGVALTSANIAYVGEQWRDGAPVPAAAQRLDFEYQIAATGVITDANTPATGWTAFDALDFTGPVAGGAAGAALDGNLPANRVVLNGTITAGVPIGQEFWIRWVDINDASNDHGLAVDDFSFTPTGVPPATDLAVTKTDSPDPVNAGADLTYTITLNNLSAVAASTVVLNDPLPAGTTLQSFAAPAGFTCTAPAVGTNGTVNCTSPSVAGSASAVFTLVVRVPSNVASGTTVTNTVNVTTTTTDSNPANNSATATTTVGTSSDISLTLTDAPDPVTAGTNLTYTATVSNAGPSDANGVTVTLATPANTSFVSGSVAGGGSCAGTTTITCTFTGPVLVGTPRAATIILAVAAATPSGTVISATANATSTSTDPTPANNAATTTTTVTTSANLSLTLTASATAVAIGQPVTFTAVSTNNGPSAAQNVVVSITLSPDFRFSSFNASAGAVCTTPQIGQSGVITCTFAGATAPGAMRTLAVTAFSNSPGTSSVQASTSSPTADPVTTNNTVSQAVVVGSALAPIPALDRYGLILLGLLFGLLGLVAVRRQS